MIKSWDLNVTASIGSAEIQDYFNKSETNICIEYGTVMFKWSEVHVHVQPHMAIIWQAQSLIFC